ncbi:hypothetical protein [Dankookia rubra]|nr:hypothetical protein [Dankookia rubra]
MAVAARGASLRAACGLTIRCFGSGLPLPVANLVLSTLASLLD